ncbi:MAG TPA: hypothetical protein VMJ12_00525 [Candidatus Acidoferrales bacterium]|nr:hypothetical protein [Candidatus Acidoferrales bacterium]
MKIKIGVLIFVLVCSFTRLDSAFAQGTAFTYQGQLLSTNGPAHGLYDFTFALYNASSGGSQAGSTIQTNGVFVTNGLFVATMDFGAGIFNGTAYWLQIGVRTNAAASFTALSGRQQLTPTPYAIYAEGANAAGLAGTIPTGNLSGTYGSSLTLNNAGNIFDGNGSGLTGVNAATLGGLNANGFWKTTGNGGTSAGVNFLGTTDNQPLELHVAGSRGLLLVPDPNGFGEVNVVGGSFNNTVGGTSSGNSIGGGYGNIATGSDSVIAGGFENTNQASSSFIGGGAYNTIGINGQDAVVPGGYRNVANGEGSLAAGQYAQTSYSGNFVWSDGSQNPFNGTGANCFDVLATGGAYFHTGTPGVNVDQLNLNGYSDGLANRASVAGQPFGGGSGGPFLWGYDGGGLGTVLPDEVSLTWDYNGNVWVSNNLSTASLTMRGEYLVVNGLTPVYAYIGDDGFGNDVQIGSQKSGVTAVAAYNTADGAYMHFYCSSITIEGGADLAEPFKITSTDNNEVPQGAVVVIDDQNPGHLKVSDQAYDARVAGVVSGANGISPGIQMQQQGILEGGKNVALTGRVYVLADASNGAIHPGDLLTTSSLPGHAMKVTDHARASGAILGKAMTGLSQGEGMVLVLVTLQ